MTFSNSVASKNWSTIGLNRSMLHKLTIAVCIAAFVGGAFAQTDTSSDAIRIETRLVSVPTIVSDRNGRYIPNLTQTDFTVFQDGVQQSIDFFAATEEPISVALLIDTSQSTRPVLDDIKDSAKAFLKLLRPHDKAMIVAFDYDVHFLCLLTSDQDELKRAIKQAEIPRGIVGTRLRDAALQTINQAFLPIKGRKAMIILTDGKDAGSRISRSGLLHSLEESDTLIYTVMFKTDERNIQRPSPFPGRERGGVFGGRFPPERRNEQRRAERVEQMNREAERFLRDMSETTAGRFYSSRNGKLKNTFASIVEELRFQYRLGFYPPEDEGANSLHELKVKVARPDAVVRARSNYRIR